MTCSPTEQTTTEASERVEVPLSPMALQVIDHMRDYKSREEWLADAAVYYARAKAGFEPAFLWSWEKINTALGSIMRRRLMINLTPDEVEEFAGLARQCQTSVSKLGQVALRQMLAQARSGQLSMVKESLARVEVQTIPYRTVAEYRALHPETIDKTPKVTPNLIVGLLPGEFEDIKQLALEWQTSHSRLGQIALRLLMTQAKAGAVPMVKPSTAENADTTSRLYSIFEPLD